MSPDEELELVDRVSLLILDVISLNRAPEVPEAFASVDSLNTLYSNLISLRDFLYAASNGDLSKPVDFRGYIGGALKTLQANLRHVL